jgi:hypothetical protein
MTKCGRRTPREVKVKQRDFARASRIRESHLALNSGPLADPTGARAGSMLHSTEEWAG